MEIFNDADRSMLANDWGIISPATHYLEAPEKRDYTVAMDAQPTLVTVPSSGIPAMLTTFIDPDIIRVIQTPNKGAEIMGEKKRGTWLDQEAMFPIVEGTGFVSSYGDFNNNGRTGLNTTWANRQSYLYQTIEEYGDLEMERALLLKLNYKSEMDMASAVNMNKFADLTYHFGVAGLINYGILNDPQLSPAITPSTKAAAGSGTKWVYGGAVTATANEVNADIQALFYQVVTQSSGLVGVDSAIEADTDLTLVFPPAVGVGLMATNNFGVNVRALLKESFPKLKFVSDYRYATAAGNIVQLIAGDVAGQDVGYCAFNEKMREHPMVRDVSSVKQKKTGGTWGAIIRIPYAIATMIGV